MVKLPEEIKYGKAVNLFKKKKYKKCLKILQDLEENANIDLDINAYTLIKNCFKNTSKNNSNKFVIYLRKLTDKYINDNKKKKYFLSELAGFDKNNINVQFILGQSYLEHKVYNEAIKQFNKVLFLYKKFPNSLLHKGTANKFETLMLLACCHMDKSKYRLRWRQEDLKLSRKLLLESYSIKKTDSCYCNIVLNYFKNNQLEKALEFAKQNKPEKQNKQTIITMHSHYSMIYFRMKLFDIAEIHMKKCMELVKNNSRIEFLYGSLLLAKKNFKEGFKWYESRILHYKSAYTVFNDVNLDSWNGESCRNLIVCTEQGAGDIIQFSRFFYNVLEKFPDITIYYYMTNNFAKKIKFLDHKHDKIKLINDLNDIELDKSKDKKISCLSLPHKLNLDSIKPYNGVNYINENNEHITFWKNKLSKLKKKIKVGLCWVGNYREISVEKKINLYKFKFLSNLNLDIISLQKGLGEEELENIDFKIHKFDIDNKEMYKDTIAIMRNIDLLICIDTSIAHIAGIMGIKTWLLIGGISEWRWSTDVGENYWYDSVKIIRSKKVDCWDGLLQEVNDKIIEEFQL